MSQSSVLERNPRVKDEAAPLGILPETSVDGDKREEVDHSVLLGHRSVAFDINKTVVALNTDCRSHRK